MAGTVSGCAVSLELGPSHPSGLLLSSFEPLSGREHCLHCPLVARRRKSKHCVAANVPPTGHYCILYFLLAENLVVFAVREVACLCEPERL